MTDFRAYNKTELALEILDVDSVSVDQSVCVVRKGDTATVVPFHAYDYFETTGI